VVKRHWKRLLAVSVLIGGSQVAVQFGQVTPALALYAKPTRYAVTTVTDSSPSKSIDAVCPAGLRVFGGGGQVNDNDSRRVMLTELRPVFAGQDYFHVAAVEPATGFDGNWSLTAYAICGYSISLLMVSSSIAPKSAQFEITKVACGYARHAVGAGGAISGADGRVGLQLVRPTGGLLDSWASGRADTISGLPPWSVTAYLVCAVNYPIGSRYVGQVANTSTAAVGCPSGTYAFGTGGGGGTADTGPVYLQSIVPSSNLDGVVSTMTGTPTGGGMVSVATCGSP
jgi:hypothetical protein